MNQSTTQPSQTTPAFTERRRGDASTLSGQLERRQFRDGNRSARPEVSELANAVDDYKIQHRRRFITFEELFDLMVSLGYERRSHGSEND